MQAYIKMRARRGLHPFDTYFKSVLSAVLIWMEDQNIRKEMTGLTGQVFNGVLEIKGEIPVVSPTISKVKAKRNDEL
jgi:hypothetical protein